MFRWRTAPSEGPRRSFRGNLAQWKRGTFADLRALSEWNRCEEGERMTYDRMVCANCAAPVSEGRCPVCRASRERLQQENFFAGLTPMTLIALVTVLIAAVALLAQQTV